MKTNFKKLVSAGLTLAMSFAMVTANTPAVNAANDCTSYAGNNISAQNYTYYHANTIKSYLTNLGNGKFMRVQGDATDEGVLVEYYDSSYNVTSRKLVKVELPVFGAFYASANNYFIVSGQNNPNASDSVEVYRVTKYDKNWNRLGSDSLYGANTTIPFDAGSARVTECGDYIIIRTCHEMYSGHQANVTIQFNKNTAKITDSFTKVWNSSYGYISHSFNQFVQVENNKLVALDHGDYYPRSVVLQKYNSNLTSGSFYSTTANTDVITFPSYSRYNYTGATLGGFEISDSSYLVAGSIVNDLSQPEQGPWNIFVSAVSKSDNSVTMKKFTSFTNTSTSASTPHFVKLSANSYMLMWTQDTTVYYTKVNGYGNKVGGTYTMSGQLSDCVPVVINNKLVWYTWDNGTIKFYNINLSDLSDTKVTTKTSGHEYVYTGMASDGVSSILKCKVCNTTITKYLPTSISPYWKAAKKGLDPYSFTYSSVFPTTADDTMSLYYYLTYKPSDAEAAFNIKVSDESIAVVKRTSSSLGEIQIIGHGNLTVTIESFYNPALKYQKTINIPHTFVNGKCSCGASEYPAGDANKDKNLSIMDVTAIQMYLAGLSSFDSTQLKLADANLDGKLDIRDATYVQMKLVGLVK